jgi:hypothetical protein
LSQPSSTTLTCLAARSRLIGSLTTERVKVSHAL